MPIGESAQRSGSVEDRLREMGLTLHAAPPTAVSSYEPWAIIGNLLITSGQLPWIDGKLQYTGRVGAELTAEQGYDACRLSTLNAISQVKAAVHDLERVVRIVRLEMTMNVAPGFTGTPAIPDGGSDLLNAAFLDRGRHSRMLYTNTEMPLDCFCLAVLWVEIVT